MGQGYAITAKRTQGVKSLLRMDVGVGIDVDTDIDIDIDIQLGPYIFGQRQIFCYFSC